MNEVGQLQYTIESDRDDGFWPHLKEETIGPLHLIIMWACGTFDVRSSNFSKQTRVSNLETQSLNL